MSLRHKAGALRARPRGFVLIGTVLAVLLAALLVGAIVLAAMTAWYWHDLPTLDKATAYRPRQHLQVLSSDGVELAQFGTERRRFVPIAQMPQNLRKAVLATEDAGFYEHGGISWRGIARATLANLSGGVPQGASTLTQQVARTFFLSTRRTAERKIKEAILALQLERELSKDQIFELYLNQIYLGQRAYGFGAAAQVYFGKPLEQIDLAEAAMLAGLPQNPIYANPVASLERATKRQRWVLQRMLKTGAVTQAEHDAAIAKKLIFKRSDTTEVHAEHAAEMARRAVVERLGDKAYTEGVKVTLSLRAEDQRAAHTALRRAVMAHERKQAWRGPEDQETLPADPTAAERAAALALRDARDDEDLRVAIVTAASARELTAQLANGQAVTVRAEGLQQRGVLAALAPNARADVAITRGSVIRLVQRPASGPTKPAEWSVAQWPQAEAAFVALDPATGRVRALVGGFEFARQQFNRATNGWRQPGSSFKPFLYSAAFEQGAMPETVVEDAPFVDADGTPASWNPKNSDGKFDGDMPLREGLVRSKNLVSARLLQQIGLPALRSWLRNFGFDLDKQPNDLTLALGSGSVTPMQMAAAYAVFANGGHRVSPVLIEKIEDAQGTVLFQAAPPEPLSELNRVLPARNVFLVNSLMADVTLRGTGARAQATLKRADLYGKTGTTNDAVDAWFVGHAPGMAAAAWMGYDDPKSLGEGESGGGLALPIWIDAVGRMLRGVPVQPLVPPAGVVRGAAGDWRYEELAEGGFIARIGTPRAGAGPGAAEPAASAPTAASAPAPVASR